jgi:predicted methyltransferase
MNHTNQARAQLTTLGCTLLLTLFSGSAMAAADIAAALSHPDRPSADADNDTRRKPVEVLTFAGLETGMSVLELEAGGGYYTEIISRAVGSNGSVILQHAPGLMGFVGDGIDVRTAGNRLPNVTVTITDFDDLDVPSNSIDMVTWIQGPHELGFAPEGNSMGDPQQSFREIARVLKPGGLLVASDHIAPNGTGMEAGGTLHRIEERVVTELALNAGLSVLRTSNILKNASDPLDVGVFAPAVRGNTSQFLIVYQK